MHYHAREDHTARHVYLHEARTLRLDLEGAQ
jgi:chorismate mutase